MSIQIISRIIARRLSLVVKALSVSLIVCSFLSVPQALAAKPSVKTEVSELRVSINKASAEALAESLVGVGIKKAKAIVDFRKKNGKFKAVEDLALVKGIGAATVEKNRTKLTL